MYKPRNKTFFYNMRRFHNWVKRQFIDKYEHNVEEVLSIASGKSGDLNKWVDNNVSFVTGYDIDAASVAEGKRRYQEMLNKNQVAFTRAEFHVLDLAKNIIPEPRDPVDVVEAMFSFHYFFESEDTFYTILQSINNNLKVGGYFIGCMFDGQAVRDKIKSNNFLGPNFRLEMKTVDNQNELFGNKMGVTLKETVLDTPMDEYIVDFNSFVDVMKWNGYELVENVPFQTLYNKWKNNRDYLNEFEKEVSFLNTFFVFKRVKNIDDDISCLYKLLMSL